MTTTTLPAAVRIVEMGPRDGLQNEKQLVSTDAKLELVRRLERAGLTAIETTSFVSPKWVPQMGDNAELLPRVLAAAASGVAYPVLTPNLKGFEAALAAGAKEVAVFGAASESFSQKNINCSIAESLERFRPVAEAAKADGIPVRGYISCVTDCPYDGPTPPEAVARVAAALLAMGCYELSLGDTIGAGTPESVARMLEAVLKVVPAARLAGHYHDTRGRACDNIAVSLDMGLRTFDAAVGGLGGCPYAPGAKGNVDTLAVVALLNRRGLDHGLDETKLAQAATFARSLRG